MPSELVDRVKSILLEADMNTISSKAYAYASNDAYTCPCGGTCAGECTGGCSGTCDGNECVLLIT